MPAALKTGKEETSGFGRPGGACYRAGQLSEAEVAYSSLPDTTDSPRPATGSASSRWRAMIPGALACLPRSLKARPTAAAAYYAREMS